MTGLDEIRARHEAGERASAVDDREWLLGEVKRLTRERDEAQSSCAYPDCVDLGPNGKCTKWLTGKCNPVLEAKP